MGAEKGKDKTKQEIMLLMTKQRLTDLKRTDGVSKGSCDECTFPKKPPLLF